jgi:hypothetical protein
MSKKVVLFNKLLSELPFETTLKKVKTVKELTEQLDSFPEDQVLARKIDSFPSDKVFWEYFNKMYALKYKNKKDSNIFIDKSKTPAKTDFTGLVNDVMNKVKESGIDLSSFSNANPTELMAEMMNPCGKFSGLLETIKKDITEKQKNGELDEEKILRDVLKLQS